MKKIIVIIILIPYMCWAYTPPRGIPAPTFGIDEDVDDYIGKSYNYSLDGRGVLTYTISVITGSPFTHYIDMDHASSTDTANEYGTEAKPRKTIPNTFAAGSVIEIHNGTYDTDEHFTSQAGTAASPTFIRGDPSSKPVYLTDQTPSEKMLNFLGTCSYIIIENIDFDGGDYRAMNIGGSSSYMCVRYCEIQNKAFDNNEGCIVILPGTDNTMSNIVVYSNTIHDIGSYTTASDEDFHGILPSTDGRSAPTSLTEVWVLENTGEKISGNLVQVNGGANDHDLLQYIYIGDNVAFTNRQSGVGIKECVHCIISENTFYDSHEYGASNPSAGITYQYSPDNLWIIFNTLYDNTYGVRASGSKPDITHSAYTIGNLIYDNKTEGITHFGYRTGWGFQGHSDEMNHYIIGNTIYNCPGGIHLEKHKAGAEYYVYNNIIVDVNEVDFAHLAVATPADQGLVTTDYNLFYDVSSDTRFLWLDADVEYRTLATFQAAISGQEQNSVEGVPLFTSSNTDDYTLGAGSPAIDTALYTGTVKNVFDLFQNNYGIDIRYDLDGNTRTGLVWDIGAYERDGGGTVSTDNDLIGNRRFGRRSR